ncbi:MAG: nicotinate (nicotinamide) nucleotide adenylyltransferase [Bacteroidaceae bacterium]|nr:nicotinate-nucleotide adenylyltransferase [Bacteroidaceae bacterium]MCI6802844.1 nicotinate-nucleotide adenylyltransferase [Prevotellaceae bacterium]MDD6017260.1 nicotinate (nicotinamide) nucleotide adenylyltransferase [Prevotellaceae bacterium]MDD7526231.1 nicotinate (nicotinamide) nucleotide adenylyltransferase [Prevotellaceae bacterium]MDY5760531.1 nicotinate (nicotinamide) nucleotide adenylyltransferase [Bacteroidaceae bacterium]
MRIGIYGGSFNPIHKGHTELAASIVQQGLVDELWLLVSPLNPLKQGETSDIAEYEHRLSMARLATEDIEGVKVSDFEKNLPLPSYTITTLGELHKAYPEHEFVLVIGADNWERFPRWYHAQEIIDTYSILIYRRPGCEMDETLLPLSVQVVDTPLYDISSTEIRESVKKGRMPLKWVDRKVATYIRVHHLYSPL